MVRLNTRSRRTLAIAGLVLLAIVLVAPTALASGSGGGEGVIISADQVIDELGLPFSFVGVVQEISDVAWTISGISVTVEADTVVDDGLAVGDSVRVRGTILEDGTWLSTEIKRHKLELAGVVESIDPWVVSGIAIDAGMWTEIDEGIEVGDWVEVEGWILRDGSWFVDEIKGFDDDRALPFEFVGRVQSIEPWIVGGVPLSVDYDTAVKGDIQVGDWVEVEGRIPPDGTLLATEIKPAIGAP